MFPTNSGNPSDTPGGPHNDHPRRVLDDPLETNRWSPLEREAWAASASAAVALQSHLESTVHRECGMTPFEYHLMLVLVGDGEGGESGELPMSAAAHRVDSSLSRLSHVVSRLEARGWLRRRVSPKDARVTLVSLTPEGRRRMEAAVPAYDRMVCRVFVDHMAEEDLAEVTRLSMRLLAGLREGHWLFDAMDPDGSRRAGVAGADAGAVTGATGESEADSEGRPAS